MCVQAYAEQRGRDRASAGSSVVPSGNIGLLNEARLYREVMQNNGPTLARPSPRAHPTVDTQQQQQMAPLDVNTITTSFVESWNKLRELLSPRSQARRGEGETGAGERAAAVPESSEGPDQQQQQQQEPPSAAAQAKESTPNLLQAAGPSGLTSIEEEGKDEEEED